MSAASFGGTAPSSGDPQTVTTSPFVPDSSTSFLASARSGAVQVPSGVGCRVYPLPAAAAVDPTTDTIYVANDASDTVSVIDGSTCNGAVHSGCGQHTATITVGDSPVYVSNLGTNEKGDTVSVINGATCNGTQHAGCGRATATVKVGPYPFGVAINEASNTIYIVDNNGGDGPASLSVLNGATCDAANTSGCRQGPPALPGVGRAPRGIAFDPSTGQVYTANHQDGTVSVLDVGSRTVVPAPPRLAVGRRPIAVAVDPANHTVYVANSLDSTVPRQ